MLFHCLPLSSCNNTNPLHLAKVKCMRLMIFHDAYGHAKTLKHTDLDKVS